MNIETGQLHECRQEFAPAGFAQADSPAPDWQGLRARLGAAHAARRELLEDARVLSARGSFDRTCANALTSFGHDLPDVNHPSLELGKLPDTNCGASAGRPTPGGRG